MDPRPFFGTRYELEDGDAYLVQTKDLNGELLLTNETHTVGNLLAKHLLRSKLATFASYDMPDRNKMETVLRIRAAKNECIVAQTVKCIQMQQDTIDSLLTSLDALADSVPGIEERRPSGIPQEIQDILNE